MNKRILTPYTMSICALCSALVAIGAFIQIPIPFMDYFTLQFFFVLITGIVLGPKLGSLSIALYVLIGLIGFPVFAAGGGLAYITRPSFGYLIGFIACSYVVGKTIDGLSLKGYKKYFIACLLGLIVTYTIGLTYKYFILNYYTNTPTPFWLLIASCFPLDLPGDIVFCIMTSFIGPRLHKIKELKR